MPRFHPPLRRWDGSLRYTTNMASSLVAQDVAGMNRPAGTFDLSTALRPYGGPWTPRLAAHLLRRAGFGPSPTGMQRLVDMPMHDAVASLIDFPPDSAAPPDLYDPRPVLEQLLLERRGKTTADPQLRQRMQNLRRGEVRSIAALAHWWLNRMLTTPSPLQEKMTLYFHGHFTTAAIQKGVTPQLVYDQNELFRSNALGNLRELTWQISVDPAMLLYLDNATNVASHPNENYARELMELFTLGVNHYSEDDVRQSARAWSGWIVNRLTGNARFVARRHDGAEKTFLGQTGTWSGRDIVNIIFEQPQCAAFFASSLLNYFVYNNPEPELVDAVAAMIRKYDYELRPVMSTLFRSNMFYSQRAYRALLKGPVEYVVGTYKAFGLPEVDPLAQRALMQMGQILFYPPNVAGWPGGENWLTSQTMIARANFLAALVNSPMMQQASWLQQLPVQSHQAAYDLVNTILYGDASPKSIAQLGDYLSGVDTSALGMFSSENYQERVRGAAYLTMAMPAYQLN